MDSEDVVFAFIDGNNLKYGVSRDVYNNQNEKIYEGWELDYKKFRLYLTNKYNVSKAYLFIGQVAGNEFLYSKLQEEGYILVFKPTIPASEGKHETKGNVDAELVLHASALTYKKYDKAIIVSSDGDFHCLVEYLHYMDKLLLVMSPSPRYSSLLRKYAHKIVTISNLRSKLERITEKTDIGGRSKP